MYKDKANHPTTRPPDVINNNSLLRNLPQLSLLLQTDQTYGYTYIKLCLFSSKYNHTIHIILQLVSLNYIYVHTYMHTHIFIYVM